MNKIILLAAALLIPLSALAGTIVTRTVAVGTVTVPVGPDAPYTVQAKPVGGASCLAEMTSAESYGGSNVVWLPWTGGAKSAEYTEGLMSGATAVRFTTSVAGTCVFTVRGNT